MYYKGTPFIERNEISQGELKEYRSYFKKLELNLDFVQSVFIEGDDNKPEFLIYSGAEPNDNRLQEYHKENYGNVPFHVEQVLSEKAIKTTAFSDFEIKSIRIFIYDELWRTKYEQWYDENFRLIEYRQLYYKGNDAKETPYEEKIFFTDSWTTLTEEYGD